MSEETSTFVARDADIDALQGFWERARQGQPQIVRLQAPFGGGRRALAAEFTRRALLADEEMIVWRVSCLDQENGLQWMVRMYGSLIAMLSSDALRRGKIEMQLNAQLPSQPKRVQDWYQQFIGAMKEAKTDEESGQVQLRLPQDNPMIALVEIVAAIARRVPILIELQNPYAVNSPALAMFCEALHAESLNGDGKIMQLLFDEPESDITKALHPMPLLDMYERRGEEINVHVIEPWGAEETAQYLSSKSLTSDAARLAEIAGGRPGFIAELVDILSERDMLGGDLSDVTLASLVPETVDEDELDVPEGEPAEDERKHAGKDDIGRMTHLAALLGAAFPANLVADMGQYVPDSIDDMLDAMSDLFEEVQFSNDLGTWIYRFKRGSYQEGVLQRNDTEEGHKLALNVGEYMERFLAPRGYGFIVKTARIYAEHGAPNRAAVMRANALAQDAPDMWGLAYDFMKYFDELPLPDAMRRTIYMNLLDRLLGSGNVQAAERVHTDVTEWATGNEDRDMMAWLLFYGSKLDLRRQDLFRARDRAKDAYTLYEGMDNKRRLAEIRNHQAAIEIQDGNFEAASEKIGNAEELAKVTLDDGREAHMGDIVAMAQQLRGVVARRTGKLEEATKHFQQANQLAGNNGMGSLALDAGLAYGEALFIGRKLPDAREALQRVVQIAQGLRNPVRERQACELLAQTEGALGNHADALPLAMRVLELSKGLKFEHALPIDLYHAGFFNLVNNKPMEALTLFGQSEERIAQLGEHPVVRELYYFKGIAHRQMKQPQEAKASLEQALPMLRDAEDWRKTASCLDHLAAVADEAGDTASAREHLRAALEVADKGSLKDMRKELKKRLEALS